MLPRPAAPPSADPGLLYAAAQPQVSRWGSTEVERSAVWPGDELTPDAGFVWTNAITIDRPVAEVWPWVLELAQGRGGLYSYSWLENAVGCDVHSAGRILPRYGVGRRPHNSVEGHPLTRDHLLHLGHLPVVPPLRVAWRQQRVHRPVGATRPFSTWLTDQSWGTSRSRRVILAMGGAMNDRHDESPDPTPCLATNLEASITASLGVCRMADRRSSCVSYRSTPAPMRSVGAGRPYPTGATRPCPGADGSISPQTRALSPSPLWVAQSS